MAQVFISYSRKDLAFIEQLVSDLQKLGMDVWYDLSGLEGGSRWGIEIRNAIQNSDYVIVVLSPDSVDSEWVEREYLHSNNLKKKILPILYRECELPLGFLNLNYIDVQGENYPRNFDKIARFLNKKSLPSSSTNILPKGRSRTLQKTPWLAIILGIATVLGIAAIFFLFNERENKGLDPVATSIHTQTRSEPTDASETVTNPLVETSVPVQSTSTFTAQPPTQAFMSTLAPTPADVAGQNVFIQSATSGNMSGNWTVIQNPLASDSNALVFAMPNFNPLGGRQVYNDHKIGVLYVGPQWAVINLDMGFMPQNASFNIQILNTDENVFIHTATSSNVEKNWTVINHSLASDPDALVFATPNCSPPDGARKCYNHAIGVLYTGSQWAIFNQDRAPMPEGAAFNVLILGQSMNAFMHTAIYSNITGHWTDIDDPGARDPSLLVFAMPRSSPGDNGVYNNHAIGVFYTGEFWAVFNQDKTAMPEGAAFNILILEAK